MLNNKILLITGGTGSFGTAVLNRFLKTDIGEIRIFSRDEKKQEDLRLSLNSPKVKFYIGDVRDPESLNKAFPGVNYIFHAAALKQVPSCEFYPLEAVKTNIMGTENVINAAVRSGVQKVVVLSTDKAVYPINAMGMSKAIMEKVMVAGSRGLSSEQTILSGTRYGNVMASRGSVIPLFLSQILSGLALTVTDSQMTRFLMSLDEAVDLVLYAFNHANQGDIFVQKAPASTVGDLAEAMCQLFKVESNIKVIGTRHGEKLYETLLTREEFSKVEDLGNYYRIQADNRDLNYDLYFTKGEKEVSSEQDYNSHNTKRLSIPQIKETLMKLPEIQQALAKWEQSRPSSQPKQ